MGTKFCPEKLETHGENFVILACTVLIRSQSVTDGRRDGFHFSILDPPLPGMYKSPATRGCALFLSMYESSRAMAVHG